MRKTVDWVDGKVVMIDQTHLPSELVLLELSDYRQVAHAIRVMQVRGAPAIGVAAALGMALGAHEAASSGSRPAFDQKMREVAAELRSTRPTAVNLFWAIDRMAAIPDAHPDWNSHECHSAMLQEARAMVDEDIEANRALGFHGAALVPQDATILTHCNAGALACAGYGTALGVVRAAAEQGKNIRVLADETRPRLQGAHLTCWELQRDGIPVTLTPDNAVGSLMRRGAVDLVVVGADRIAANGDVANKIGTYNVAVLAKEHDIPFYVAAPTSTIDLSLPDGAGIPIEERSQEEVTEIAGHRIAPEGVAAVNPAFDVTPAKYVRAIITERGLAHPPYEASLRGLVCKPNSRDG